MSAPTPMQSEVLQVIRDMTREQGYPPTVREIGEAVGLTSPSTVHAHLAGLERRGCIKRDPAKPRTITLTEQTQDEHATDVADQARYWAEVLEREGRHFASKDLNAMADELDRLRASIPDPGEGR